MKCATASKVFCLDNNRYACHFSGHNTGEFKVLIFEIDPNTYKISEKGIINPSQGNSCNSSASGECILLSNGNLLTYHDTTDNVQIWDTHSLSCIKEWKWKNIQTPKEFNVWCLRIIAFPDSEHLLIRKGDKFYLFDMQHNIMKTIQLNYTVEYHGDHFILTNGQLLAFIEHENKNVLNVAHIDLHEMKNYRQSIIDKQQTARWILNKQNKIPKCVCVATIKIAFFQKQN